MCFLLRAWLDVLALLCFSQLSRHDTKATATSRVALTFFLPCAACAERAIALESLEHNAAANDAANQALNANAGLGLQTDSAFTSKSGGNAASNDAAVDEGLGLETDSAFAGHSGGNAADNDAEVDGAVGEEADDFFGGDSVKKDARSDDAGAPRNYLAGLHYRAPNYLAGRGW